MRKVLHFTRKDTQLRASFIQNQILNHIGFVPTIVFREKRNTTFDGGWANDIQGNIPRLNLSTGENLYEKYLYKFTKTLSKRQAELLHNYISEHKPEILHFHYGTDAGIYLKAVRKLKIPKVVSFYGYECSGFPRRFLGYGKVYLQKRVFKYADKVFAMSEDMKNDLLSIGCPEEKIIVHYYGTDVQRFNAHHDYSEKEYVRFLIISGLVPQKGHSFLLKAFAEAYKTNPNIRLTIVGSGELDAKIRQQILDLELNEIVSLPGPVVYGSAQHKEYFASHDVFIHPSITDTNGDKEGIPGAIVEAMAAGLPVISTYHAGIPHIIDNGKTGLLSYEHDVSSLSDSILQMASSQSLRETIGKAGQSYALSNLDLFEKEKELEWIYGELIAGK